MIIEKVSEERWKEAQRYELNFWKPHIQTNPKETWKNFEPYFKSYFHEFFNQNWEGKTVLEIGVGASGAMWLTNATRKIGVEPLANALLQINPELYKGYEMISHGAEALPEVQDAIVDAVMSFNAIDHCQSVPAIMAEIKRILKPGGQLAVGCDLKSQPSHLDDGHPIALSGEWFAKWLDENGFAFKKMDVFKSRNFDLVTGKDNLDGCLFFIGEKK